MLAPIKAYSSLGRASLQRRLSKDCFEDSGKHVSHFWSIIETRPYMRVLQTLVRLYFEEGRFEESAYVTVLRFKLSSSSHVT
jgi:hypothetical protein